MYKLLKISPLILYIIVIFLLMFSNKQIISSYNTPKWLIPSIFFTSVIYLSYQYIRLKLKEDELEQEIISVVNHTFRTPLTSITWRVKELENNLPQNEKNLLLQDINNNVTNIINVVDLLVGINDVKNTSTYYFKATSLREIIEESIKKYRDKINKKNIAFQISNLKNIPLLTIDLKKISFVIDTVIENAILYTNNGGKIFIDSISQSKKLTIYISDTGIGLNFVDKLKIFSKFYRSKKAKLLNTDGLGLRLYLAKKIIKKHHGKMYARSNGENEGSTFFIELPYIK